jgi:hypothetical protein
MELWSRLGGRIQYFVGYFQRVTLFEDCKWASKALCAALSRQDGLENGVGYFELLEAH